MASSPGLWPGVVLPRLTPDQKSMSPCRVWRSSRPPRAAATVDRPPAVVGCGAQERGSAGTGRQLAAAAVEGVVVRSGEASEVQEAREPRARTPTRAADLDRARRGAGVIVRLPSGWGVVPDRR